MLMKVKSIIVLLLCSSFLLPSCVSSKKYQEAQSSLSSMRHKNRGLEKDLQDIKQRLQLMEQANEAAAGRMNQQDSTLTEKQNQLSKQQERLEKLQQLINRQKSQTEDLRKKMADALSNFNTEDLSVFKKNGKVYVRMSDKLLFPSGSALVDKAGKEALEKLAEVLNQNQDIKIDVEGHTDSIPIRIKFQDNWALSVARATSVVRILVDDYKVNPERLTASGRSKYDPVSDNETEAGRAKNRRTEIILEPKLTQLMELIQASE